MVEIGGLPDSGVAAIRNEIAVLLHTPKDL